MTIATSPSPLPTCAVGDVTARDEEGEMMDNKPRLLDLFCGAGGAAMGYHRADFEVVGVDIKPMPRYPFPFILGDAIYIMPRMISGEKFLANDGRWYGLDDFDAIHASPPCQKYTRAQNAAKNAYAHPDLVDPVRKILTSIGRPYVIENVVGAPLINYSILCGLSFGLRVRRHRLFEASFFFLTPPCQCKHEDYYVIFGHEVRNRQHGIQAGRKNKIAEGRRAMGIDWMTRAELSEAIPPAYTQFIGDRLISFLRDMHADFSQGHRRGNVSY